MIISFKFSVIELEIEHKILKELGEFTIFCMKAISNDMKIKDISNIIQIKKKIIKNQLAFAISRKYLTDDFILTQKGIETVKLFEFINNFNQRKVKIALEHYIENDSKLFYSANNKKFEDDSTGYLMKDNLFYYKLQNKFDEIIEKDRSKIKDFILVDFDDYKTIIENYLNDFIFKINKNEKQKFYNYQIDERNFINELSNEPDKMNTYIPIDIPMIEINKDITSDFLDEEFINNLKLRFNNFKYFNLINGEVHSENRFNVPKKSSNLKLESKFNEVDIIKKIYNLEKFIINELLLVDMKTETKKFYDSKFLNVTKIMDNI